MKNKIKEFHKNRSKIERIVVPDINIVGMDKTSSMWLHYPDIPFSRQDVVIARRNEAYDTEGNDYVVGVAYPLYFAYTKRNLFPLTVQMSDDELKIDIIYYSFKLNKILIFAGISVGVDNVPNPLHPITIKQVEMIKYADN